NLINDATVIHPIKGSPQIFGYRNRAQFKTNGEALGYVAADETKRIVDIHECLVLNEKNQGTLAALREQLPNEQWEPSDDYEWNFIEVDDGTSAKDIKLNIRLPFRQGNTAQNDFMRAWLREQLAQLSPKDEILELFSGSGNFTECLVGHAPRIIAAEASDV